MLLDELMPDYDVVQRHRAVVRALPDQVFAAIRTADLAGGGATRALFLLRGIPAAISLLARSPRAAVQGWRDHARRRSGGLRLADFERTGFRIVAERAPSELVIGLLGRFWTPRGDLAADVSEAHFAAGPPPGYAIAGWSFTVEPLGDEGSLLRTETRVLCAPDARARFRIYWFLVRPGSGLIRRSMLRSICREAERRGDAGRPGRIDAG